jgi:hypothetical protein
LRASHPGVTSRTVRNAGQVEKIVRLLKPGRWTFRWLLRPQDDGTLRPRRSVCYSLGALMPTTTIRLRQESRLWWAKLHRAIVFDNKDDSTIREAVDEIAVEAFAERLCRIKPTAAEAMRLVRAWHRKWQRQKAAMREDGDLAENLDEDQRAIHRQMLVSVATDICTET